MNQETQSTIEERKEKQKEQLLEQLKKTPVVQFSCEKNGIGRATYYRWRNEDEGFKKAADDAIAEGTLFINDLSEFQVISLIRDKNWPAISFWLKHHHPSYATKVEVMAQIKESNDELTPEQEAVVREALRLSSPEQESLDINPHV